MEVWGLVGFLLAFAWLVALGLGVAAFFQVRRLRAEVLQLRRQLGPAPQPRAAPLQPAPPAGQAPVDAPELQLDLDPPAVVSPRQPASVPAAPGPRPQDSVFWQHLKQQWMVWLGGACVALAGIFLARYSIEQGLLGPVARVVAGILTGLALHGGAFWLRLRLGHHNAFAALAGGGSITLFATLLAALHWYQLFSPLTVFAGLALVALATLWLALVYGPVLAAIGMIGAYTVPALVSTGSGNYLAALAYALVISAAVLALIRRVERPWLWWGVMAGGLGWWALSMTSVQPDGWRGVYLALLAYGVLAIPSADWRLVLPGNKDWRPVKGDWGWLLLAGLVVALCISVYQKGWYTQWFNWSLLPALLLWVAAVRNPMKPLVWASLLGPWAAVILSHLVGHQGQWRIDPVEPALWGDFVGYNLFSLMVLLGLAGRSLRIKPQSHSAWALLALWPCLLLVELLVLMPGALADWQWALLALVLGGGCMGLAVTGRQKQWPQGLSVWGFVAGHLAYSLAVVLMLESAGLTLALAAQSLSLAWIIQRYQQPLLAPLLKLVLLVVVVRLTLNPWLVSYPSDSHWSLWTFGGATLFCWLAARQLVANPALARWAEAASLHLLVLTLWSEARYWLYDGDSFKDDYSVAEAITNLWLFGALSLVYEIKARASQQLAAWYRAYSLLQMMFGLANYGLLLAAVLTAAPWLIHEIGSTPLFNLLLPAFLGPVLLAGCCYRWHRPQWRRVAATFAALAAFVFVSLEIRHLWQGSIDLSAGTSDGEMYTYSAVWLAGAVTAMLAGSARFGRRCYQAGMALLGLVIAKIFLIDMADLQGLWRVASFMGLGLGLLGLAFLHQKIQSRRPFDAAG